MNEAVTVAVASMNFVPSDIYKGRYQDSIALSIAFENKTRKDIAGVKGAVQFNDMFGAAIKSVGVSWDAGVKVGAVATWDASLGYNQFMAEDKKLASTPLHKMKVVWTPETILFTDGSKMPAESVAAAP
jgi:hypothetical protein